ncbi:alpha/beta hydrolase [Fulvivirgaceae bacterium BMA10]|uniref:Alpha/beta hydrolase n=1 Tax=Splendidivirga corallicola TaxID=3051826 RepID=A0ABT8KJX5_9BACT|nr:alpha/beta hydrolase [Fulvivirgaceae bacterium BMA10]
MDVKENFQTIHFKSKDELLITADFYPVEKSKGFILLCHRSHCNRGEYRETAPEFNSLGFSCLAIDQRSGMKVFGVINETAAQAKLEKLPTGYLDAKQDIEAAVDYAFELNENKPIIILGSSYSASLALLISTKNEKIKAVITFSPGEYLKGVNLAEEIKSIDKPTYVTSAKKEVEDVKNVMRFTNTKYITQFEPEAEGFHGSKTLWASVKGHESFWESLKYFLSDL